MEVTLRNAAMAVGKNAADLAPRAYIFTTGLDVSGIGPAGMFNGSWKKLYDPTAVPQPKPSLLAIQMEQELASGETTTMQPLIDNKDWNTMQFRDMNKVTLSPKTCFANRGPLYLVACAVNTSMYGD